MTINITQGNKVANDWLTKLVLDANGQPLVNTNYQDIPYYKYTPLYHDNISHVNGTSPVVNNPYGSTVDLNKMNVALNQWLNVISYLGTKNVCKWGQTTFS